MQRRRGNRLLGALCLALSSGATAIAFETASSEPGLVVSGSSSDQINLLKLVPQQEVTTPPKLIAQVKPEFPFELRKQGVTGKVTVEFVVNQQGGVTHAKAVESTDPGFEQPAVEAVRQWKFEPGRLGEELTKTILQVTVSFDFEKKPPRAQYIVFPAYPAKWGAPPMGTSVELDLVISDEGKVLDASVVDSTDARLNNLAIKAVDRWRYEPAELGETPPHRTRRVSVSFAALERELHGASPASEGFISARRVRKSKPIYPYALRRSPSKGTVEITLSIGANTGEIKLAHVSQSSDPALDEAALLSVLDSKFEPAWDGEVSIASGFKMQLAISPSAYKTGPPWTVKRPRKFPAYLSVDYHWKKPPALHRYSPPIYPYWALDEGVAGEVVIRFEISPEGRALNAEAVASGDKNLQAAAIASLYASQFVPAMRKGRPCWAEVEMGFEFNRTTKSDAPVGPLTQRVIERKDADAEQILSANKLDEPLRPLVRKAPLLPKALRDVAKGHTVMIECIVDKHGFVQLPHAITEGDPVVNAAAVHAAAAWRFAPPLRGGVAVDCRVILPFKF